MITLYKQGDWDGSKASDECSMFRDRILHLRDYTASEPKTPYA